MSEHVRCRAAFSLLLLAACSSTTAPAGSLGWTPPAIKDVATAKLSLAAAICHYQFTCGYENFASEADCNTGLNGGIVLGTVFDSLDAVIAAMDSGKVTLDIPKASACASYIGNLGCTPTSTALTEPRAFGCGEIVASPLADGATCITDDECAAGSLCFSPLTVAFTIACTSGVCQKIGVGCRDDSDCLEAATQPEFCIGDTDGGIPKCGSWAYATQVGPSSLGDYGASCVPQTPPCIELDGGSADGGGPVYSCNVSPCKPGLVCQGHFVDGNAAGHCAAPASSGPCGASGECAEGSLCVSSGLCKPTPPPGVLDGPCAEPPANLTMQVSAVCEPGLVCVTSDATGEETCQTPLSLGDSCTDTYGCGGQFGSLVCDVNVTHTCIERPGAGSPCPSMVTGTSSCDFSSFCGPGGSCVANAQDGASCMTDADCGNSEQCFKDQRADAGLTGGICKPGYAVACAP